MRFSERIGKRSAKVELQVESIDQNTRNRIWNCILEFYDKLDTDDFYGVSQKMEISTYLWKEFFKQPIDDFPKSSMSYQKSIGHFISTLREWYFKWEWYEVYDFVEIISQIDRTLNFNFTQNCNNVLDQELAGYKIINGVIVQITSEVEVEAIQEAINNTTSWTSVNTHLEEALKSLSDRQNPNYRNSIKESISALEATCKIITGDEKATLGKALAELEDRKILHKALKTGFSSIYGYVSDSGGIRHALKENDNYVDGHEAKFMLISCSAFINYLISKTQ